MISRTTLGLRTSLTNSTPTSPNPFHTLTRLFSSYPSNQPSHTDESTVYRDSRKFARPATVTWSERLHNSVSFIGTLEYPFKRMETSNIETFGVYSVLRVKSSPHSHYTFRIHLTMWGTLAERAFLHLKPHDFIYVSGYLGSYTKSSLEGTEKLAYKITANEFNYVQVPDESVQVSANSKLEDGQSYEEKYRNRLLLWQLFFANPHEWRDQRKTKMTSKHPDFKNKSTSEALWLRQDDPPWVKKQLELLDSKFLGGSNRNLAFEFSPSKWVSDEQFTVPDSTDSRVDHQYFS